MDPNSQPPSSQPQIEGGGFFFFSLTSPAGRLTLRSQIVTPTAAAEASNTAARRGAQNNPCYVFAVEQTEIVINPNAIYDGPM